MASDEASPDDNVLDPWTPEQESALLKALVHYKPAGLHAHFRMISIRNYLLNSGTTDAETVHTRIPGIWAKVNSLYDLKQLDEREDEVFDSLDDDDDDEAEDESSRRGKRAKKTIEITTPKKSYWRDFELAGGQDDSEFETLMWERRLNPEGSPDDSDSDARSQTRAKGTALKDEQSSPVGRGTRSGRKGRVHRLKDEMDVDSPSSTRSSRRASKAASEAENEDEDHPMEDAEDDDDKEGAEDDDEESEDPEEGDEDTKNGASKRGRGGNRGRSKRGRRRK